MVEDGFQVAELSLDSKAFSHLLDKMVGHDAESGSGGFNCKCISQHKELLSLLEEAIEEMEDAIYGLYITVI